MDEPKVPISANGENSSMAAEYACGSPASTRFAKTCSRRHSATRLW